MKKKLLSFALALAMCMTLAAPALAAEQDYKVLYQSSLNFTPWSSYGDIAAGYSSDDNGCRLLRWTGSAVEAFTPTTYRYASVMSERYAVVNYTQIIDLSTGETVVPAGAYDSVSSVNGLYAIGFKGTGESRESYLLNLANGGSATRLPDGAQSCGAGRILVRVDNNHYYYTDMEGNRVMTLKEGVRPGSYRNGYTAVSVVEDSYLAAYAIMAMDGMYSATFIHPRFVMGAYPTVYYLDATASYVSDEGLICIGERTNSESTCERYGYADVQGNIVIPCEYTRESHAFRNGYAVVMTGVGQERQCALIDTTGKVIIPMGTYQTLSDVSTSGILWARDQNNRLCILQVPVTGLIDAPYAAYYGKAVQWGMETGVLAGSIYVGGVYGPSFQPDKESYILSALCWIWLAKGKPAPTETPKLYQTSGNDTFLLIQWAAEQGLSWGSGTGDIIEGTQPITRAQMMYYLWKLAGSPAAGNSSFTDVPAGTEYAQAIAWAVETGITSGTGSNTFSPDTACTNGQIITFVYRAFGQQ